MAELEMREDAGLSPEEFREKVRFPTRGRRGVFAALRAFAGGWRRLDIQRYVEEFADVCGVILSYLVSIWLAIAAGAWRARPRLLRCRA
eukprot:4093395-Pyramimonas_sp.AAC.1